ncbi:ABC transporter permease [Aestuariivirga sp.]|uniref:ABC transporter permease n=1 Tax=Aestuariivirga sp. TaxID=2650926 RepID=UPI0039E44C35
MAEQMKPGVGPLEYGRRRWLQVLFGLTLVVLYLPIAVLIAFSFNQQNRGGVWKGFTLENYPKAWHNQSIYDAMVNSLTIAFVTTLIATVIGTMVAVMMWRFRFPIKPAYEAAMGLPIVIPEICMGVALLLFFNSTGIMGFFSAMIWPFNLSTIIIAHIAFCFPFVAIVVRSRLVGFNKQLEEASRDLGANEWQTFWQILVPFMKPGIIAGALLAFTLSLDDFVITFFTAGPETVTFPVKIYSMVKTGVKYEVNAASTILIFITILATVLAMKLQAPEKSGH